MLRRALDAVSAPADRLLVGRGSEPAVTALIYHRVGAHSPSPVDLSRESFSAQLDLVMEHHTVIDMDTAVAALRGDAPVPQSSVVLTFDDGTVDWVEHVLPELSDRSLPATFYVSTDFVERRRPFPDDGAPVSWSGLDELRASGLATIGSHTHTHCVLSDVSNVEARDEVDRSVGLLEDRLGIGCEHFAYPKAIAPSAAAEAVVRRRFCSAVLAGNRTNRAGCDVYRLGRHGVTAADGHERFARKVAGGERLEGWLRETRDELVDRRRVAVSGVS
jgi:peptidoglycan/xylan/chitin deacetylase (PgdA/CDA1 family)